MEALRIEQPRQTEIMKKMPPAILRHRSSPSLDKLLGQLDENEVYLLLAELNNSFDVHIPVAKAIEFYEKPSSSRHGHVLLAEHAISPISPPSSHYHHNPRLPRDIAFRPPVSTRRLSTTTTEPVLSPAAPHNVSTDTTIENRKLISNSPNETQRSQQLSYAAVGDAEHTRSAQATHEPLIPKTSRAYKRISRPLLSTPATKEQDLYSLLAVYLWSSNATAAPSCHPRSLNSSRSMVDLRLLERGGQMQDRYRPADLIEPMVLGARGQNLPPVLERPALWDAPGIDSLFTVLNES